ncbi:MAG: T9SS type A sorting domain-containing protein [Bacteroidota bacterium]
MTFGKYIGLLACLLAFEGTAQISFFKAYSDQGYEVGEGIVQLPDSGYLLTGSTSSTTAHAQAFISRVDSMGTRLWTKTYGGSESEHGRRIFFVENDGIYVAGQSNSGTSFHDAYFFKTDLSGNLLYEKTYGSLSYDNILDGVMLPDTSFLLVGETYNTSNEQENLYLLRINKLGDTLWTKNIGSEGKDVARAVAILNDTTVMIAGEYYIPDSLMRKAMLMRLHVDGTVEWTKTYGISGNYAFNDLHIQGTTIRAVGNHEYDPVTGYRHQYVFRCDEDGIPDIQYDDVHDGDFSFEHLVQYGPNPDNFYFCTKASDSPQINTYEDGSDLLIYRFTGSGMYYIGPSFFPSNTGDDIANEAIPTSDGGAMLIGWNEHPVNGGSNLILIKIGPNDQFAFSHTIPLVESLVSLEEEPQEEFGFYPNPVQDVLFVGSPGKINIQVRDHSGRIVMIESLVNGKLDVSELSPGLYFLSVEEKGMVRFLKN